MSDKKPLTIITVCYNEKEAERTCKSILNQTFQNFEWIVIDGGSNKEILEIFDKYKERIDIFVSEKDNGIYDAMNKGIKLASNEWLNFMNAGDSYFEDTTLEKVFLKNKYKDADILYGNCRQYRDDGSSFLSAFPKKLGYLFWQSNCLNHQAAFIKKELFNRFGLYDEQYRICADYEKYLLYEKEKCRFKHLNITVSNFFPGGVSNTYRELADAESESILDKYYPYEYKTVYTLKLFDKIPFMRIKRRRDNKKYSLVFLKMHLISWNYAKKEYN